MHKIAGDTSCQERQSGKMLKNNGKDKNCIAEGFYTPDMFNRRLLEERRRSERSGLPFAILSINLSNYRKIKKKLYIKGIKSINNYISDLVVKNCRRSDIKTWESETSLKIILPDTSLDDARQLTFKLEKNLNNGFRTKLEKQKLNEIKANIYITAYPEFLNYQKTDCENSENKKSEVFNIQSKIESPEKMHRKVYSLKWERIKNDIITYPLYSDLMFGNVNKVKIKIIKRAIDISGAFIGCIVFSPLMILIAALVKLSSKGPIIFKQERLGFLGEKFWFFKFRSMYHGCDDGCHKTYIKDLIENNIKDNNESCQGNKIYKIECDNRITPIGRFLRKTSLDELPQFFNVLKGDMSLVGPRPPIPYEVKHYQKWHLQRVLEVKPGITGLWQVNGRSRTTFDEMVRMDIAYLNNYSLWLDIKIIMKTISVVFTGKGGY